mgnify:CR=1 FL=1
MHTWGIDGHQLTVEITESMMMEHDTEIFKRIQILRDMGIGLSVDDFGTGFSGLSRLVSLPVTEIKIDKSFVDRCLTEKTHPCLTRKPLPALGKAQFNRRGGRRRNQRAI